MDHLSHGAVTQLAGVTLLNSRLHLLGDQMNSDSLLLATWERLLAIILLSTSFRSAKLGLGLPHSPNEVKSALPQLQPRKDGSKTNSYGTFIKHVGCMRDN